MTAPVVLDAAARLALFPAMDSLVYLNTGSAGPLLAPVEQVMTDSLQDRKSTRLNSSPSAVSRMPSSA